MIDAVQELIQTHEAFEEEGGSAEKDAKENKANGGGGPTDKVTETKEGDEVVMNEVEGVRVDNQMRQRLCLSSRFIRSWQWQYFEEQWMIQNM